MPDTTPPAVHQHPEPPGPPARWETIARTWDAAGTLPSERTTTTVDTDCEPAEPERLTGCYL